MVKCKYSDLPGCHRLKAWLEAKNITYGELAELLGQKHATIVNWIVGRTRPDDVDREAIFELSGIARTDWLLVGERAERSAKLARIMTVKKAKRRDEDIVSRMAGRV